MDQSKYFRGHLIELRDDGATYYCDTGEPTIENWKQRGCGYCNKPDTPEGHDGCLGTLDEKVVMNACCGHGIDRSAYIQFWDGSDLRGKEAIKVIQTIKTKNK